MPGPNPPSPVPDRSEWLDRLEHDVALDLAESVRERGEVLDRLETCFPAYPDPATARRVEALRARFEAVDRRLAAGLRADLRAGRGRERLLRLAATSGAVRGDHYDHLDDLVAGLLQLEAPAAVPEPQAEMVFYQPTPARHVFDLVARSALGAGDVFVDLGSGLGHVPMLVGLCTDARATGIEWQPAYVERARAAAAALQLQRVVFVQQDARAADLSTGTVFYLYTPFTGSILRAVLDALRVEAGKRPIRVCSYGPCTHVLAREPWLASPEPVEADRIALFGPCIG